MQSSGLWCCVAERELNILQEHTASFFRAEKQTGQKYATTSLLLPISCLAYSLTLKIRMVFFRETALHDSTAQITIFVAVYKFVSVQTLYSY
jgi:hypothetical protein